MKEKEKPKCEYCGEALEAIKEEYEKLQAQYDLPSFKEINEDFDISKVDCNTGTILRDVRKMMVLKFSSILQFVELLLNPSSGSMFHMFLVKGINGDNKDILNSLFEGLGTIEINSFELDINYSEKDEADFIKRNFHAWNSMKPKINTINKSLKDNWKKTTQKKDKSYFG